MWDSDGKFVNVADSYWLYGLCRINPPSNLPDLVGNEFALDISEELIDKVEADHIIVSAVGEDDTLQRELLASPLWQALPAVQNDQAYIVQYFSSYSYEVAFAAINAAVEGVLGNEVDTASVTNGEMRTITDAAGNEIEIPANPQRIVTLTEMDLDSALALGVTPVGSVNGRGQQTLPSYLLDQTEGVESIGSIGEPNPEVIASLDPDLIIVGSPIPPVQALLPALAEIAPVAVTFAGPGTSWQDALTGVADVLGRTDEAEAFIADYDARVANINASLPADFSEASIIRWNPDGPVVMLPNAFSSGVIADVGIGRPQAQVELPGAHPVHSDVISMEQIQVIDSDVIFAGGLNPDGASALSTTLDDPLMQALSAVQNDRLIEVDGLVWGSVGGPIAATTVLDDVEEAISRFDGTAMAGGYPREVEHFTGTTLIEERPTRIYDISYHGAWVLYSFGVEPIAYQMHADRIEQFMAMGEALGTEFEMIGIGEIANLELIVQADPDLILGAEYLTSDVREQLEAIAPVVDIPGPGTGGWRENIRIVGDVLAMEDEAEAIIAEAEKAVAESLSGSNLPDDATFAFVYPGVFDGLVYVCEDETYAPVELMLAAGLEMTDTVAGLDGGVCTGLSLEVITETLADTDLLVLLGAWGTDVNDFLSAPVISAIPAVEQGEYYVIEGPSVETTAMDVFAPSLTGVIVPILEEIGASYSTGDSQSNTTIEIEHELGTITLDGIPERIVVLEYSFADNLGTLGVAPVGYAVDAPPEYVLTLTEELGAEAVGTRKEPNLEAIIALNPDFIIADLRRHEAIYDQLSAIAPTVIFNSLRGSYQDQLDTFGKIAQALGKEDEAAEMLDAYQTRFETVAAETNADAGDFVIGVLWADGYTAHSNESFMGSFIEDMGRTNALDPQDGETQYLLDIEGLAAVNPSSIVILCSPNDQAVLDAWEEHPVWQAFDAVQNNRVYFFDRNLWSKGRGLIAFDTILDNAVDSGLLSDSESSTATGCP